MRLGFCQGLGFRSKTTLSMFRLVRRCHQHFGDTQNHCTLAFEREPWPHEQSFEPGTISHKSERVWMLKIFNICKPASPRGRSKLACCLVRFFHSRCFLWSPWKVQWRLSWFPMFPTLSLVSFCLSSLSMPNRRSSCFLPIGCLAFL